MKNILFIIFILPTVIYSQVEVSERNEWGDVEVRETFKTFTITINDYKTQLRIVKVDNQGKVTTEIYQIKEIEITDSKAYIPIEYEYDKNKRFLITINLFKNSAVLVYNGTTNDLISGVGFTQNLIK